MRIAIALCTALLAAAPAMAEDGNPIGGVGVSVETSPGGVIARYNNANEARAACLSARGTFSSTPRGGLRCTNPRTPLVGTFRAPPVPTHAN